MKIAMKIVAALLLICTVLPVQARVRGATGGSSSGGPVVNTAQSGVVGFSNTMFPFVNLVKQAATQPPGNCNYPNVLTQGVNLPNGTIPCAGLGFFFPGFPNYTGKYVVAYQGTLSGGNITLDYNNFFLWGTVYSATGATLANCSNGNVPPCIFEAPNTQGQRLGISGTNVVLTLDFSVPVTNVVNNGSGLIRVSYNVRNAPANVTITGVVGSDGNGCGANGQWVTVNQTNTQADLVGSSFPTGCTYTSGGQIFPYTNNSGTQITFGYDNAMSANLTSFVMCKQADYLIDPTCKTSASAPQAWAGGFNDDFLTVLGKLHVHHVRMLDVNPAGSFGYSVDWNGWQTTSAYSYGADNDFWAKTNWFNTDTGTNSYAIDCRTATGCTYTLTGGVPQDGDFFQFYNVNASTSVNPTLTITDKNGTASSAIPMINGDFGTNNFVLVGGTPTSGDTISMTFNTTPLGAYTCLAGGTHTTTAYTVGTGGAVYATGTVTGGTGYVNGTYNNVPLTGGAGTGATAQIIVAGGVVTTVNVNAGTGSAYVVGNTLSASNTNLGGTGSGFSVPVTAIDSAANITSHIMSIAAGDATLTAQPLAVVINGQNIAWAVQACATTVTFNITGAATETAQIGPFGGPFEVLNTLSANTLYTGVYSKVRGGIAMVSGGQRASWPYEVQIDLAKALTQKYNVQFGCWLQASVVWSDASLTALANYAAANQCPGGTYFELGNENWNPFNPNYNPALNSMASVGNGFDSTGWQILRTRQLASIVNTAFGGLNGNAHVTNNFQQGGNAAFELNGATLCGTSCGSNHAYQNYVGVDYNASPNRPGDFTRNIGHAPYYNGIILGSSYVSAANYGTWSSTSASIASNVLTVGGTITGTVFWNQGVSSCDGTYISSASNFSDPTSAQLTGKVTTTLNGAQAGNQAAPTIWTLTSVAGIQPGMWVYDQTTGVSSGTVVSVNAGANQITLNNINVYGGDNNFASAGAHDTIVFGGQAGTYQLNSTSCAASTGTITGGDVLGLQYAADNYCTASGKCATGHPGIGSTQDAYNWVYTDALNGVLNGQMSFETEVMSHLPAWQNMTAIAANYSGMTITDYEGGYQPAPPCGNSSGNCPFTSGTQNQAVNMGLPSAAYGYTDALQTTGYVAQLLIAFKNSSLMKQLETTRHNVELANYPTGSMSMWFTFEGSAQWGLFNPPFTLYSTPYQSYNAICSFNGGTGC